MEDLSHLAANSMWATSQHSGNRPSDNSTARTAPGTPSPAVDTGDIAPQPFVQPEDHAATVITDGNDTPNLAPFTAADSSGWKDAADDKQAPQTRAKKVLRMGQWNEC